MKFVKLLELIEQEHGKPVTAEIKATIKGLAKRLRQHSLDHSDELDGGKAGMTIFRYEKDNQLYLLSEARMHYYGEIYAEPYNRTGESFIVKGDYRKKFKPVGVR